MRYYIVVNNEKQGPFSMDELARMNLKNETLVWREGMESWDMAAHLPELKGIITPPLEPHIVPWQPNGEPRQEEERQPQGYDPAAQNIDAEPIAPTPPAPETKKKGHGCLYSFLALLALLVVLAVAMMATKPDKEAHKQAIGDLTSEVVNQQLQKSDYSGITSVTGSYLASSLVSKLFDQFFTVHDYGVCTVGEFNVEGFHRKVSFGVFGHVFTFNKEDVEKELGKWASKKQDQVVGTVRSKANSLLDLIIGGVSDDVDRAVGSVGSVVGSVGDAIDSVSKTIDTAAKALDKLNEVFGEEPGYNDSDEDSGE